MQLETFSFLNFRDRPRAKWSKYPKPPNIALRSLSALGALRGKGKSGHPTGARQANLTNLRGIPVSEPYRGFCKRTHLHTTLNKSRDERTDAVTVTTTCPWAPGAHQQNGSRIQFSAGSNPVERADPSVHQCARSLGAHIGMVTGLCMLSYWISVWANLR